MDRRERDVEMILGSTAGLSPVKISFRRGLRLGEPQIRV